MNMREELNDRASESSGWATAWALLQVADAIETLATHVKYLGTGNATTQMGALELLSMEIKNGAQEIANAIREHAI